MDQFKKLQGECPRIHNMMFDRSAYRAVSRTVVERVAINAGHTLPAPEPTGEK